ncbi:hypothetical protein NG799_02215 [Laspinema sp. D1]|uniref:50S ribosomal protein L23 n=1 Tax=Laspinema palackyanum D2a TaxID=2953684 RepID=A0ABT2MK71_9CYAN|nr:hypothetical protein [Laspinema sp. D2a]
MNRQQFIEKMRFRPNSQKAKIIRKLPAPFWREIQLTINPETDKIVRISPTSIKVSYQAKTKGLAIEVTKKFTGR